MAGFTGRNTHQDLSPQEDCCYEHLTHNESDKLDLAIKRVWLSLGDLTVSESD
jgi:hypothetical protein